MIVPVEIESDISEGDTTKLNLRALPNSSIFSELMTKTIGSLMSSSTSLKIKNLLLLVQQFLEFLYIP